LHLPFPVTVSLAFGGDRCNSFLSRLALVSVFSASLFRDQSNTRRLRMTRC